MLDAKTEADQEARGPGAHEGGASLVLLPDRAAVRVGKREVKLTPTQLRLLGLLLGEPGRVFRRDELVERALGVVVTARTVDAHIKDLRRKIAPHGARIEIVRGHGYRYQGDIGRPQETTAMTEQTPAPKRLLFVCVENSNRSQMAEAFARLHGGDRVEAYSAGSRPSGRVNPKAVEAMREKGYDLTRHHSKGLGELSGVMYDAVVGMGCGDAGCPLVPARLHEEWDIPDPRDMTPEQFRGVRDLIEAKVKDLLARL